MQVILKQRQALLEEVQCLFSVVKEMVGWLKVQVPLGQKVPAFLHD